MLTSDSVQKIVAPREGSVDRNAANGKIPLTLLVAPREGSVDRNLLIIGLVILVLAVAPREGSVDRNLKTHTELLSTTKSLPARGAWREMYLSLIHS